VSEFDTKPTVAACRAPNSDVETGLNVPAMDIDPLIADVAFAEAPNPATLSAAEPTAKAQLPVDDFWLVHVRTAFIELKTAEPADKAAPSSQPIPAVTPQARYASDDANPSTVEILPELL
jgi:hypothetical protein